MEKTINTSIKQVPAVFTKYKREIRKGHSILNYGCGRYPELVDEFLVRTTLKFDPYYDGDNGEVRKRNSQCADVTVCANVLNVIESD